ncbi:hypothetical protein [Vibrio vulnificus]|uniref:F4 family fimbrial subunit n=1 Tax=Vibrio vulnificus TaxID=672 RepID=UPI0005F11FC6|nr:hypothetical protein [Vibrio vulnificus]
MKNKSLLLLAWTLFNLFLMGVIFFISISVHAEEFKLPSDIQFVGTVVNGAPQWQWYVHPEAQNWAADWDANASEGVTENGETVFSYTQRNSKGMNAFVQGYTGNPVAAGELGLTPVVTVMNANGQAVTLNGNTEPQKIDISAIGHLSSGETTNGVMSLNILSAVAVAYKKRDVSTEWYTESYEGSVGWAATSLILDNVGNIYKNNGAGNHIRHDSSYDILAVLQGLSEPNAYSIMASFTSHMRDVQTRWKVVPDSWEATLIAQVQLQ